MEKKEYTAPEVTVYGDVKEITKSGGTTFEVPDADFTDANGNSFTSYS